MFRPGVYIVFALTPTIVLYCHDGPDFEKLKRFDNCLSPVSITSDMANHENAGHAGMSARFIFSSQNDFAAAKAFLAYIDSKPPPTIEEMLAEDAPNDP